MIHTCNWGKVRCLCGKETVLLVLLNHMMVDLSKTQIM